MILLELIDTINDNRIILIIIFGFLRIFTPIFKLEFVMNNMLKIIKRFANKKNHLVYFTKSFPYIYIKV